MSGPAWWALPGVVIVERKETGHAGELNQALEHIERRLDQDLDVAEPARIAATSEYHLRRMFSALAGNTAGGVRPAPRRLTLAGAEVLAGRDTLLDGEGQR